MATYASRPAWGLRARALSAAPVAVPLGLGVLLALSLLLRARQLDVGFWVDEALSIGIADRPLADIPGILRLDGSPPLYYVLLHFWVGIVGRGEEATHALSLLFALLAVPVSWWGASAVFGARAGWMAAVLAAFNSFLTQYAQETRMYSLVVLLGLVVCASFARAFALPGERARPAWLAAFAVSLAALLYTHNWSFFLAAALGITWLGLLGAAGPARRGLLRDGLLAFGAVAVLYLPWVPTFLYQAAHTGAPWSQAPSLGVLLLVPRQLLGEVPQVVLLLCAGAGLATLVGGGGGRLDARGRAVVALVVVSLLTVGFAWATSQLSPAWASRYLAIALPPVILFAGAGLAHAGRLGLVGAALVAVLWTTDLPPKRKSNVREVAQSVAPSLAPGDLVVATQPEQIPSLDYYLPAGLRYATLTGPVGDVGITDWRDGVERLERTSPERDLAPLLDRVGPGERVVLVEPNVANLARWSAPWTSLVRQRSAAWRQHLSNDSRFRVIAVYPRSYSGWNPNPVSATVFMRRPRE